MDDPLHLPHRRAQIRRQRVSSGPSFAGRKMVIRYEPYDISRVYLWEGGRKVAVASPQHLLHQVRRGTAMAKRNRESTVADAYLEGLEVAHEMRLQQALNLTQYPTKEEQ